MLTTHGPRNVWWGHMPGEGQVEHPIVSIERKNKSDIHAIHGKGTDPRTLRGYSKNFVIVEPHEVPPASSYNKPLTKKTYFIIRENIPIPIDNLSSYIGLMVWHKFREIKQKWLRLIEGDYETRGE
jgi:hypothetical protein